MPIRIQKLCATLVLCLCLTGISSTAQNNPDSSLPALEVITVDNADRIEELAVYGGGLVEDAEWSADGSILAISGSVGIQLYDSSTTTYSPLGTLTGHNGDVSNVAWASNDMRLASTGEDSTVRIWDIQNQMESLLSTCQTQPVFGASSGHMILRCLLLLYTMTAVVSGLLSGRQKQVKNFYV